MPHDVFLSYSRDDSEFMQRLRDDLHQAGFAVWTDEAIEPGSSSWKSDIENAIRDGGCLVVLLSPGAAQSKWVRAEIDFAESLRKPMYMLLVRGDETNAIPFGLTTHQRIEMLTQPQYSSGLPMLVHAITNRSVLPVADISQRATTSPLRNARRRFSPRSALLLVVLLVLIITAGIWVTQRSTSTVEPLVTPVQGSDGQWITQRAGALSLSVPPQWAVGLSGTPSPDALNAMYSILDQVSPNPQVATALKAAFPSSNVKLVFGNWGTFRMAFVYVQNMPMALSLDVTREFVLSQAKLLDLKISENQIVSLPAGNMLRLRGHAQSGNVSAESVGYFFPVGNKLYATIFDIGNSDTFNNDLPSIIREIDAIMQTFSLTSSN